MEIYYKINTKIYEALNSLLIYLDKLYAECLGDSYSDGKHFGYVAGALGKCFAAS